MKETFIKINFYIEEYIIKYFLTIYYIMSNILDLSIYDKIIISDLSLNGDLSFNDAITGIIGVTGPVGDKGDTGPTGLDGPVGHIGPTGAASGTSVWDTNSAGSIYTDQTVRSGAIGDYTTVPFRLAGFTSEMYVGSDGYLRFSSDETTSTNGIQNGQVILYNYGSGGTVPAIRIMGKDKKAPDYNNSNSNSTPTVDRHNDWEIKSYSSGSDRRLGFCFLYGGNVQPRG